MEHFCDGKDYDFLSTFLTGSMRSFVPISFKSLIWLMSPLASFEVDSRKQKHFPWDDEETAREKKHFWSGGR